MRPLLAAVLLTAFLAGCSQGADESDDDHGDDGGGHALDASTYTITLSDFPVVPVGPSSTIRFNGTISGQVEHASDHIGAHFGNRTTTEPSTTVYTSTCAHTGGELPGRYQVTCEAPIEPGTYFLRGHARITDGNATFHWWSAEHTFTVA